MKKEKSYDDWLKRIAKNIQKARKRQKLTQEGMTEHGFDYRHYQRIESGKYSMNLYTLYRLSEELNTDLKDFFE